MRYETHTYLVPFHEVRGAIDRRARLRAVGECAALVANEPPLAVVRLPGRRRVVAGVVDNRVAGVVVGFPARYRDSNTPYQSRQQLCSLGEPTHYEGLVHLV